MPELPPLIAISATILDQEIFCTKKEYFETAKYKVPG